MTLYAEFGEEGPLAHCSLRRRAAACAVPLACSLFVCPSAMFFAKSVLALLISLPALNEGRIIPSLRYVGRQADAGGRAGRGIRQET